MVDDSALLVRLVRINEDLTRILEGATSSRQFNLDSDEKRLMAVFLAKACKTHQAGYVARKKWLRRRCSHTEPKLIESIDQRTLDL